GWRRTEVTSARWAEFDLGQALWTIPAARMKAGAAHEVPLTEEMLTLLRSLPRTGEFLFPSTRGKPLSGFSALKVKLDRLMLRALRELAEEAGEDSKAVKLEPWALHDARRSFRTHLSSLPVPDGDLVRELLLA